VEHRKAGDPTRNLYYIINYTQAAQAIVGNTTNSISELVSYIIALCCS